MLLKRLENPCVCFKISFELAQAEGAENLPPSVTSAVFSLTASAILKSNPEKPQQQLRSIAHQSYAAGVFRLSLMACRMIRLSVASAFRTH